MHPAYVTVRRIDQSYRVLVRMDGLEHTHKTPLSRAEAWRLGREIRIGLADGYDLNLVHWESEQI